MRIDFLNGSIMENKKIKYRGRPYRVHSAVCEGCRDKIICVEHDKTLIQRFVENEAAFGSESNSQSKFRMLENCLQMMSKHKV